MTKPAKIDYGILKHIKGKQQKRSTIKNKLDRVFSRYIRTRDSNKDGYGRCISCGKFIRVWWIDENGTQRWNHEAHAGHYYSRGHSRSLYYDEKNVNLQCSRCNSFKGGAIQDYAEGLAAKYGPDILMELRLKANNESNLKEFELTQLYELYKKKLNKLESER